MSAPLQSFVRLRVGESDGLPAAAARGAASFFGEPDLRQRTVRVCRGTSCVLAGADGLRRRLGDARPVYCVGYCDRSPAVLRADDRPVVRVQSVETVLSSEAPPAPGPPAVRCEARQPIVTHRIGRGDYADLDAARGDGAYESLRRVLRVPPPAVIDAIERSGERGRGGAAFPTGRKWRAGAGAAAPEKFVIANGDEGDPGSFIDRVLMEQDPHAVIEGLAICGYAIGAARGIVFVRAEYPEAAQRMQAAAAAARAAGILGPTVLGGDFAFDVTVHRGRGSYVCGEETAMLNAIEGFRGEVRMRPPYPTQQGLRGMPTVVNNVETLVCIPWIIEHGADAYARLGTADSSGTKALCLNHGFSGAGIVEVEFGATLGRIVEANSPPHTAAVAIGGPMGSILTRGEWEVPICYTAMAERGIQLGHGGMVAILRDVDVRGLLVHWLEFMAGESCGKCVPCRAGSKQALELARDGAAGGERLSRILDVMAEGSLCAFGRLMPGPMRRLLELAEGSP